MGDAHEPYDDPNLKGLSRIFNNKTVKGRANVAIATFVSAALYYVYSKFKPKDKPTNVCHCPQDTNHEK